MAPFSLALVVGVWRRNSGRSWLSLHRLAVLGTRPHFPHMRISANKEKKTYQGDNTFPDVMQVDYHFPDTKDRPAVHLTWYHGVSGPGLAGEETYKGFSSGILFVGEKGKLVADYGKYRILPDEFAKDFTAPPRSIPASIGHHKE